MKDSRKHERMETLIGRLAAEYVLRESQNKSLITITRTVLSEANKYATIFFSSYPENYEQEVLQFLERKASNVQAYIEEHSRMGRVPFLKFAIDEGEKNRLKIDSLSAQDKKE